MSKPDDMPSRDLAGRIRGAVSWVDTLLTVLGWFGWKSLLVSVAVALAGWAYGYVRDEPVVTLTMSAIYLFIGIAYATKLPAIANLMSSRPNVAAWRYVENLTLGEAACLFADVSPAPAMASGLFPTSDSLAFYRTLAEAVHRGDLERGQIGPSGPNPTQPPDHINLGTPVTRRSLHDFALKRGLNPRFLR